MSPLHLSNPFRRDPDAPTLNERGAALKAGLTRAKAARPAPQSEPAPAIVSDGIAEPVSAGDPLVADFLACWREGAAIPEANREDGDPLFERWYARRDALLSAAEALPATRDSLAAKALAFTWIWWDDAVTTGQARADHTTDGRLALDINAIACAPAEEEAAAPAPDPFLAAVGDARAATATIDAFERRIAQRKPKGWMQEETTLVAAQTRTQDAALATVPTTQAGRIALADYMAELMGRYGMADGGPPEDGSSFWPFAYHALSAALRAPIRPEIAGQSNGAAAHDLSGASIRQLARLYDHLQGLSHIASMACNAPMAWDDNRRDHSVVGHFLEDEHARLDDLAEAVVAEIRTRAPASDSQRDDRLATIVKREMEVNIGTIDESTLAEIAAAWGA